MMKYAALKGFYEVEKTIGCGGFAKVKLGTHIATGEKVAIKIMEKASLKDDLPRVKLELRALKTLSHKHICKLYQVIETETHYFLIVEYCSGGELFDHIVEKSKLSESESRIFFRQILSAVAYLHTHGYAHRDLKPENVLLDHAQKLKLIDFGLCAQPAGGMESPLFTSCGSPTYAAPELVLGKQYLGTEVDVWAMGVLLYALLAGFLPFDDHNIDSLYKKILSGRYEEPAFMSQSSRKLIKQMLQVDPKKRITVNDLLIHPWLKAGGGCDIQIKTDNDRIADEDILSLMAQYHGISNDDMWRHINRWRYDYNTSTYMLLVARKQRGLPLKLQPGALKHPVRIKSVETITTTPSKLKTRSNGVLKPLNGVSTPGNKLSVDKADRKCLTPHTPHTPKLVLSTPKGGSTGENDFYSPMATPDGNFLEPRKPSSIRKPMKRIRSPNYEADSSPVPLKKTPGNSTPRTPERKSTPISNETSSARKVLGSIERSLHKVRHVLTPRKSPQTNNSRPAVLSNKDLCNVSTTQCSDPEYVVSELSKALQKKGIQCVRKGFTLRGKMEPNTVGRFVGGCSFELEICYLPMLGNTPSRKGSTPTKIPGATLQRQDVDDDGTPSRIPIFKRTEAANTGEFIVQRLPNRVGIRRKRLKGDSWCYKKVCEQVLALTATELKQTAV